MNFSPQQEKALNEIKMWLDIGNDPIFRLFGYAGTGKTSLAKHIAELSGGKVFFCAFTGKAAHSLHMKGCEGASTIHSLIYLPKQSYEERAQKYLEELETYEDAMREKALSDVEKKRVVWLKEQIKKLTAVSFVLDEESEAQNADLIIVDECSMVSNQLAQDLMSFDRPILALGDPAQLPPVKGAGYFNSDKPDVLLTEVHRQALDNPVLRLATDIRQGKNIPNGQYEDSLVIDRADMSFKEMTERGQILCGRNATRRRINYRYRKQLGWEKEEYPVPGDRLISLKNNKDDGLFNGTLCTVRERFTDGDCINSIKLGLDTEVGEYTSLSVNREVFRGYVTGKHPDQVPFFAVGQPMDYSYAITVHKSQGSQWENVVVCNETPSMWDQKFKQKWLYTAVTRASHKVTILN